MRLDSNTFPAIIIFLSALVLFSSLYFISAYASQNIDGNTIYVNDSKVYLSATPYIINNSGYVYFNFTSKVFSGYIDLVLGYNSSAIKPISADLYNPRYYNKTVSYTCNPPYWYNYTLSPKYFWCWDNTTLVFEHAFEWANLSSNTAYWNELVFSEYDNISGEFKKITYNYKGMDTWYYKGNIPIIANRNYMARTYMSILLQEGVYSGKYKFCIKPSIETLKNAIINNHLYCLDLLWAAY